jgi:hypothetical protein
MKAALLLVTTCWALSQQASGPAPQETKAIVHFYRERAYVGSVRKMPIFVDEVKIADLVNGRYFTTKLDPGKHVFRCQTRTEAISVVMEPGTEYYLRAEIIQGFTKNHWRLVQMSNPQGEADIQRLKPLNPQHIAPLARGEGSPSTPEGPQGAVNAPQQPGTSTNAQPSLAPPEQVATATITSTPEGADIEVDGKFVGSTPSTIHLSPGEHTVSIKKSGFKPWQRTLTVGSGGTITVEATLENQ